MKAAHQVRVAGKTYLPRTANSKMLQRAAMERLREAFFGHGNEKTGSLAECGTT